ncbi:MAG: permease-like cell division protein FtsX [Candidatus Aminicenantales bacterium]
MVRKMKYFLKETMNNLWQYKTRNIFSVTIICLSFLIVGTFLSLSNNLRFKAQELSKNLVLIFYLQNDLPEEYLRLIEGEIKRPPFIANVRYVRTEDAQQKFLNNFPELQEIVENLESNPFPASFEATLKDPETKTSTIMNFIADIKKMDGIEDVQFNRDWAEKMHSLSRLAQAVGFFLGGILILASFFIISNVIKLNVFARKSEIDILRLVGATNTFIRISFLMEGTILGITGSLLSLLFLYFLNRLFPIYLGASLGAFQELISFRYLTFSQAFNLTAGGAIVGFLGSLSSLSRFLRI